MQQTVPQLPPFNWQKEYAPLWEGRNDGCLNDILFRPGPEDILTIDGIRAPFRQHLERAKQQKWLHPVNTCKHCNVRPKVVGWRYCRQCYDLLRAHAHQCGLPLDTFTAREGTIQ